MVYDVFLGTESIGKAEVGLEGLYYRIFAKCCLSGTVIYKLYVSCGENTIDLGIFVPEGKFFCVQTKLPAKRLGTGTLQFWAVQRHSESQGKFIPLSPEKPFAHIKRLGEARLQVRDGKVGIVLDL